MMVESNEIEIIRVLSILNPWWEIRSIPDVERFRRLDFNFLQRRVSDREIISIVGARQVGKTTLMEQLIDFLLSQNKNTYQRILMIYGNNTELNTISENIIKESIDVYEKYVLKEEISKSTKRVYVFIDEVQHIKNWFNIVKDYYNINKNIKFIVSGSSSVKILKDSIKAFVGRAESQIVVPFKFLELLRFNNFQKKRESDNLMFCSDIPEIRDGLRKLIESKRVTKKQLNNFFFILEDKFKQMIIFEKTIKTLLNTYFVKGGYPAVIKEKNQRRCVDTLSSIIRDVINTDIKDTHQIRENYIMEKLLVLLSKSTSDNVNVAKLSSALESNAKTITEYIGYLEDAFIISTSENYRYSQTKRIRKKIKKIYLNDIGLRNVVNNTFIDSILLDPVEMGKIVETVVHNHCLRLKFKISSQHKSELFYWRDEQGEVDIVLEHNGKPIPIEVKYKNKIDENELKNIKRFIKKYGSGFGICVTKDTFELNGNILMIPTWLFLLIC